MKPARIAGCRAIPTPRNMLKTLIGYAVVATALLLWCFYAYRSSRTENRRLAENQQALSLETEHYRTRLGQEAASVQALRLRCAEFETLRAADAEQIRALGIRLRRLEATAKNTTKTELDLRAPLRDTLVAAVVRKGDTTACAPHWDTLRSFRWRDPWVTVEGRIDGDTVACRVVSIDTLHQIVHRVPRRFLFIRWGTKALRQEIVSTNPHTRIVYAEYVKIER